MPKYQINYKTGSKTFLTNIEADNITHVKQIFNFLCVGEIMEIREFIYENKITDYKNINDVNDSFKYCTIKITNDSKFTNSLKIPKFKKRVNQDILNIDIKNTFLVNDKKPTHIFLKFA